MLRRIYRQSINYSRSGCFNRSYQFSLQCAYSFEIVNVNSAYITIPVHQICRCLGKYLVQNKHTEICKHTEEPYSVYMINFSQIKARISLLCRVWQVSKAEKLIIVMLSSLFLQQQMNMFGGMPPMGMMGPGPSNMGYQNMRNFPPYGMVGCV